MVTIWASRRSSNSAQYHVRSGFWSLRRPSHAATKPPRVPKSLTDLSSSGGRPIRPGRVLWAGLTPAYPEEDCLGGTVAASGLHRFAAIWLLPLRPDSATLAVAHP